MLAPGVRQGIEFGNLSFAVGGLLVLALLAWERNPVASGLLLGASLLIKPLALAALPALFFHRPQKGGHRHQLAVAVAVVAAALPLLADPELGAFLRHGSHTWVLERTVSLHRFLALADARGGASILTLLLLAGVAAVARARVTDREQLLAVALAGCVMVTPLVWNHTLVLTVPLQAMAIGLALARWRAAQRARPALAALGGGGHRPRRRGAHLRRRRHRHRRSRRRPADLRHPPAGARAGDPRRLRAALPRPAGRPGRPECGLR